MNTNRLVFAALFLAGISNALSQGTAFMYQGKLANGGAPANGSYDLAFTLYNANTAGAAIAGPVTNSATAVSNGLFSTTIDFGAGVFNGSNYWLDISVSPTGSNTFVELTPRQAIMPTPYAIYSANAATATVATSAASVSASNISGTVSAAQLPGTVLTNGANSVNLAGSFSGNGSGLTGINGAIPWRVVCGTNVQAASNTGYLLTNNSPVTVVLPPSPNFGDIVRISCPGLGGWKAVKNAGQTILNNFSTQFNWTGRAGSINEVALSADGTKVVATFGGYGISTSTNSGATWTVQAGAPSETWVGVASSLDGTKLAAIYQNSSYEGALDSGGIYTSTNSGVTWVDETNAPSADWASIVSSADGTKLAATYYDYSSDAVFYSGGIYTSTNSGATWVDETNAPSADWFSIASSADGTKLAAVGVDPSSYVGNIYISTDSGVTWIEQANAPTTTWSSIVSSADGTKLAAIGGAQIYTSKDSGVTWGNPSVPPGSAYWTCIASSADGAKLVAGGGFGQIDTSSDGGISWVIQQNSFNYQNGEWAFVASSADGTTLFALVGPDQGSVYIRTIGTDNLSGDVNSAVELQYVGNGQFLPISYTTGISAY